MKTVADFKRRIVKGVRIHTIYHQASKGRDANGVIMLGDEDRGIRPVNIVQTNSFTLMTEKEGKQVDSWMNYPKAKEVIFSNSNSVQILTPDFRERNSEKLIPCVTYTFV